MWKTKSGQFDRIIYEKTGVVVLIILFLGGDFCYIPRIKWVVHLHCNNRISVRNSKCAISLEVYRWLRMKRFSLLHCFIILLNDITFSSSLDRLADSVIYSVCMAFLTDYVRVRGWMFECSNVFCNENLCVSKIKVNLCAFGVHIVGKSTWCYIITMWTLCHLGSKCDNRLLFRDT